MNKIENEEIFVIAEKKNINTFDWKSFTLLNK